MILTALYTALKCRHLPASIVIMGSSAGYTVTWSALKLASLPFGERIFFHWEDHLYAVYQWMIAFFFEKCSGVEFVFYGDDLPRPDENILYLSNHQSTVDWVIAEQFALRAGAGGVVRYILKDSLKYVPLYGYFLYKHGSVFIRRKRDAQGVISLQLQRLLQQKRPLWLCLFPEGTRFSQDKSVSGQLQTSTKGYPPLQHVLQPKVKGLQVSLETLWNYMDAVYDLTILYEARGPQGRKKGAPHLFEFFSGRWSRVHIHVCRTNMTNIPKTAEHQRDWLQQRYTEKDRWLEAMKQESDMGPCRAHPMSLLRCGAAAALATVSVALFKWRCSRRLLLLSATFYFLWGLGIGWAGLI